MTKGRHSIPIAGGIAIALLLWGPARAQGPRTADGKPDLSGVWRSTSGRYLANLAAGGVQVPFQSWSAALYKERQAGKGKGNPADRCLPRGIPGAMLSRERPWKIVQTPGAIIILFDEQLQYRQIHTDGRGFPADAAPTWFGYSVGKWDGGALLVETIGFNDDTWLDDGGHPHSEALRVTERFRRRNTGSMDIDITIDDPKAYTKPWTTTVRFERVPETELGEHICAVKPES
jgi:hypothetical protein